MPCTSGLYSSHTVCNIMNCSLILILPDSPDQLKSHFEGQLYIFWSLHGQDHIKLNITIKRLESMGSPCMNTAVTVHSGNSPTSKASYFCVVQSPILVTMETNQVLVGFYITPWGFPWVFEAEIRAVHPGFTGKSPISL